MSWLISAFSVSRDKGLGITRRPTRVSMVTGCKKKHGLKDPGYIASYKFNLFCISVGRLALSRRNKTREKEILKNVEIKS